MVIIFVSSNHSSCLDCLCQFANLFIKVCFHIYLFNLMISLSFDFNLEIDFANILNFDFVFHVLNSHFINFYYLNKFYCLIYIDYWIKC